MEVVAGDGSGEEHGTDEITAKMKALDNELGTRNECRLRESSRTANVDGVGVWEFTLLVDILEQRNALRMKGSCVEKNVMVWGKRAGIVKQEGESSVAAYGHNNEWTLDLQDRMKRAQAAVALQYEKPKKLRQNLQADGEVLMKRTAEEEAVRASSIIQMNMLNCMGGVAQSRGVWEAHVKASERANQALADAEEARHQAWLQHQRLTAHVYEAEGDLWELKNQL